LKFAETFLDELTHVTEFASHCRHGVMEASECLLFDPPQLLGMLRGYVPHHRLENVNLGSQSSHLVDHGSYRVSSRSEVLLELLETRLQDGEMRLVAVQRCLVANEDIRVVLEVSVGSVQAKLRVIKALAHDI